MRGGFSEGLSLAEEALQTLAVYPTDTTLLARVQFLTARLLRARSSDAERSTALAEAAARRTRAIRCGRGCAEG